MKIKLILFTSVLLLGCITSCSPHQAMIKTTPKLNDIIISPEMKSFSKSNKNPSVVLRVPYTTGNISESDEKKLSKNNNIYNQIEKNLLKLGFTVRDRGLLNNLLSTGQSNYSEIGKKIQTDIIVEILSIDFSIDNYCHTALLKKTNKEIPVPGNVLNPKIAKIECKLTIVDKGLTGGVLTLYQTPCTDGCDFLFSYDYSQVSFIGRNMWYSSLNWLPDYTPESTDRVIAYFSNIIADIIRGNIDK